MIPTFTHLLPSPNLATRESIFAGEVYRAQANATSRKLVDSVTELLADKLGTTDIRRAHAQLSEDAFFAKMGELRRIIYLEPQFHRLLIDLIASHGFDPARCAFDPIRLRVILPGGHLNPKAAPVYYAHRDTWYAHPQCLIVGWIPLHDLREEETFDFYPDYFAASVPNDSEIFDYADWIKDGPALKIGWQKSDSGLTGGYPQSLLAEPPSYAVGFDIKAGEALLFAGSQFHKTRTQDFGTMRLSLDFRVVQLDDVTAGRGAPNADNRSRGNILADYIHPAA